MEKEIKQKQNKTINILGKNRKKLIIYNQKNVTELELQLKSRKIYGNVQEQKEN